MFFMIFLSTLATALAQENGTCTCGTFITIQNSGFLPPEQNQVGPVYELPVESPLEVPCNGNTEAACDLYCDTSMETLLDMGYDLDTVIEVEVGPGIFENQTVGSVMCQRSYQLHPNPDRYNGTPEGGAPVQLAVSIDAGRCSGWTIRREYPELTICCTGNYEYIPCDASPDSTA